MNAGKCTPLDDRYKEGYRQALLDVWNVGRVAYTNNADDMIGKWHTPMEEMYAFNSMKALIESELGDACPRLYERGVKISPLLGQFVVNLRESNLE